jgi:hypothetical protein
MHCVQKASYVNLLPIPFSQSLQDRKPWFLLLGPYDSKSFILWNPNNHWDSPDTLLHRCPHPFKHSNLETFHLDLRIREQEAKQEANFGLTAAVLAVKLAL